MRAVSGVRCRVGAVANAVRTVLREDAYPHSATSIPGGTAGRRCAADAGHEADDPGMHEDTAVRVDE